MSKQEQEVKKTAEEMTTEELAADIERQQKAGEGEPEPEKKEDREEPEELTFTAIDGAIYKGKTPEELFANVTAALNNTKTSWRDQKRQLEELKPSKEKEPEKFSNDRYYELLATSPLEAKRYAEQFDETVQQLRQFMTEQQETAAKQRAVLQFYTEIPDYGKVETPEVTAAFKSRMEEKGRAVTTDNLKLTYLELRYEGKIPEAPEETRTTKRPPPRSPTSSARQMPSADEIDKINAMTTEQLKAHIQKQIDRGAAAN